MRGKPPQVQGAWCPAVEQGPSGETFFPGGLKGGLILRSFPEDKDAFSIAFLNYYEGVWMYSRY